MAKPILLFPDLNASPLNVETLAREGWFKGKKPLQSFVSSRSFVSFDS